MSSHPVTRLQEFNRIRNCNENWHLWRDSEVLNIQHRNIGCISGPVATLPLQSHENSWSRQTECKGPVTKVPSQGVAASKSKCYRTAILASNHFNSIYLHLLLISTDSWIFILFENLKGNSKELQTSRQLFDKLSASERTEAPPELEEEMPLPSKSIRLLKTSLWGGKIPLHTDLSAQLPARKIQYSKYMNEVQPQEPPVSTGLKSITSSHSLPGVVDLMVLCMLGAHGRIGPCTNCTHQLTVTQLLMTFSCHRLVYPLFHLIQKLVCGSNQHRG